MAERIVSPGVFTRERDLSFLPQGIGEIGAAILGPTQKGPSFVPTVVTSFSDFERIFGTYSTSYYTPYTIKEYLREMTKKNFCYQAPVMNRQLYFLQMVLLVIIVKLVLLLELCQKQNTKNIKFHLIIVQCIFLLTELLKLKIQVVRC